MKKFFKSIFYSSNIGYLIIRFLIGLKTLFTKKIVPDIYDIKKNYQKGHGLKLNLKNPKTLTEKIQWLKLYDRRPIHTIYADKFAARDYLSNTFGPEHLVPLVFHTTDYKEINPDNMPNYPFIIKPNHGSGWYHIIMDKKDANWHKIQTDCRFWLSENYYYYEREWQYKNIPPRILVEKLLICSDGGIPSNYRFHCFSGRVEIISITSYLNNDPKKHCTNKYDRNWNPLYFSDSSEIRGPEIDAPKEVNKMITIAEQIANDFKFVRVDFFVVDRKIYYGEITMHDSGGYIPFNPREWDTKLGDLIKL